MALRHLPIPPPDGPLAGRGWNSYIAVRPTPRVGWSVNQAMPWS